MIIDTKLQRVQNHCIFGTMKYMDLLKFIMEFDRGWFDKICDRIKYLTSEKNCVTDSINNNFARIKNNSYNSLPIEKILIFHNFTILF